MRLKHSVRKMLVVLGVTFMISMLSVILIANPVMGVELDDYTKADIDWQQFSGQTLDLMLLTHPWFTAIEPLLPMFEQLTGMKLKLTMLPESQWWTVIPSRLTAGTLQTDVLWRNYFDSPKYAVEGWTAPLGRYILDPRLTDLEWYDWMDFILAAREIPTISNTYEDEIPVVGETVALTYRNDIYEQLGLTVPETFEELLHNAEVISSKTDTYGITLRGSTFNWWPLHAIVMSYGGDYLTRDFKPAVDSPEMIAAVEMWNKLSKFTPPGFLNYDYEEVSMAMMNGVAANLYDSAIWYPALQDPSKSKVVGKVGIAPSPNGPAGRKVWTDLQSLCIFSGSNKKKAAWLFLQWASSKPTQIETAIKGIGSTRYSVWRHPKVIEAQGEEYTRTVSTTLETASVFPVYVNWAESLDILRVALQEITGGKKGVREALNEAQETMTRMEVIVSR